MDKKEEFKSFARLHPELIDYVKNNKDTSWQKLYEIYDIYGDDIKVWNPYFKTNTNSSNTSSTFDFKSIMKNIDADTLQEHIKSAQKALGFIEELTNKGASNINSIPKGPTKPRPINKLFGD